MLLGYILIVDVFAKDITIDEKQFRERVDPSLAHLHALKGAFDRKPSTLTYYPPSAASGKSESWSARGVVMVSLGKDRALYLNLLYQSILHLIELELPDYEVQGRIEKVQ